MVTIKLLIVVKECKQGTMVTIKVLLAINECKQRTMVTINSTNSSKRM